MADIKGIELASEVYGLEDEQVRDNVETNTNAIGTLANLETTAKTNLVSAINEVKSEADSNKTAIGNLTNLKTTAKANLVAAVNEILTTEHQTLPNITLNDGFTADIMRFQYLIKEGGIAFGALFISNIDGSGIGSTITTKIGESTFRPAVYITALGYDYVSNTPCRCAIDTDGSISLLESKGVAQGNNQIRIPFVSPV